MVWVYYSVFGFNIVELSCSARVIWGLGDQSLATQFIPFCVLLKDCVSITGNREKAPPAKEELNETKHQSPKTFEKSSRKSSNEAKPDTLPPKGTSFAVYMVLGQ